MPLAAPPGQNGDGSQPAHVLGHRSLLVDQRCDVLEFGAVRRAMAIKTTSETGTYPRESPSWDTNVAPDGHHQQFSGQLVKVGREENSARARYSSSGDDLVSMVPGEQKHDVGPLLLECGWRPISWWVPGTWSPCLAGVESSTIGTNCVTMPQKLSTMLPLAGAP